MWSASSCLLSLLFQHLCGSEGGGTALEKYVQEFWPANCLASKMGLQYGDLSFVLTEKKS
jgi:hypothetical protein